MPNQPKLSHTNPQIICPIKPRTNVPARPNPLLIVIAERTTINAPGIPPEYAQIGGLVFSNYSAYRVKISGRCPENSSCSAVDAVIPCLRQLDI